MEIIVNVQLGLIHVCLVHVAVIGVGQFLELIVDLGSELPLAVDLADITHIQVIVLRLKWQWRIVTIF